MKTSASN